MTKKTPPHKIITNSQVAVVMKKLDRLRKIKSTDAETKAFLARVWCKVLGKEHWLKK